MARVGTDVHGFIGKSAMSYRRVFTAEPSIFYTVLCKPEGIILPGIPGAPAFQTAVAVAVTVGP